MLLSLSLYCLHTHYQRFVTHFFFFFTTFAKQLHMISKCKRHEDMDSCDSSTVPEPSVEKVLLDMNLCQQRWLVRRQIRFDYANEKVLQTENFQLKLVSRVFYRYQLQLYGSAFEGTHLNDAPHPTTDVYPVCVREHVSWISM